MHTVQTLSAIGFKLNSISIVVIRVKVYLHRCEYG